MNAVIDENSMVAEVAGVRRLSESVVVVRFDRCGLLFTPGQYLSVGLEGGHGEVREYSIYSNPDDDGLEILVKDVKEGAVSPRLCSVEPGDRLFVSGPYGHFTIADDDLDKPFLFVATGTGISPFHCFAKAYPKLDYRLLHGVRHASEQYDRECYGDRYVSCLTRDDEGDFHGRVTGYIPNVEIHPETRCYLCGNCDMIYDAFAALIAKGLPADNVRAEVYF